MVRVLQHAHVWILSCYDPFQLTCQTLSAQRGMQADCMGLGVIQNQREFGNAVVGTGWSCDGSTPCGPDTSCVDGICTSQSGEIGDSCGQGNGARPTGVICQESLICKSGTCQTEWEQIGAASLEQRAHTLVQIHAQPALYMNTLGLEAYCGHSIRWNDA